MAGYNEDQPAHYQDRFFEKNRRAFGRTSGPSVRQFCIGFACPTCEAAPGEPCHGIKTSHYRRRKLAFERMTGGTKTYNG